MYVFSSLTASNVVIGALVTLLALLYLMYRNVTYPYGYFDQINVPHPKPVLFFGNVREIKKAGGLHRALIKWMKKYGHVYGFFALSQPFIVCSDPDKLKQILVKNFSKFKNRQGSDNNIIPINNKGLLQLKDDAWKRVRSTLSPTFTSGKMKLMYPLMKDAADTLLTVVEQFAKTGESANANRVYEHFTMDVIASTVFGIQLDCQNDTNDPFVVNARQLFGLAVARPFANFLPKFMRSTYAGGEKLTKMVKFWNTALKQVYDSRENGKIKRKDMLHLMIEASKEEQTKSEGNSSSVGAQSGMSGEEIKGNIFTFLLAGYETTSNLLAYTTYLLATNPREQEKLYEDIAASLNGQEPNYDNISDIPYLDYVIKESLRMYPPAHRFVRRCNETCEIDGLKINAGDLVMIPVYAMHRNPEFFHDPDQFIPERFHPENEGSIRTFTYLPFGEGPRSCIGMRFALLEAKLALTLILLQYTMRASDKTEMPLKLSGGITLTATNGVFVNFVTR